MRLLTKIVAGILVLYLLLLGGLFVLMLQPPARFGKIMAYFASPTVFMFLPFEQLWLVARDGNLEEGDPAPDFSLQSIDRKDGVRLSSFQGEKPVVLIFGSYT
ncbi:MAG: hypothetical protein ACRD1R_02075 [Acidobacteriota bacterium]